MTDSKSHYIWVPEKTPNGKFFIKYCDVNDPSARKEVTPDMTRAEILEFWRSGRPETYNESKIEALLQAAEKRFALKYGKDVVVNRA